MDFFGINTGEGLVLLLLALVLLGPKQMGHLFVQVKNAIALCASLSARMRSRVTSQVEEGQDESPSVSSAHECHSPQASISSPLHSEVEEWKKLTAHLLSS